MRLSGRLAASLGLLAVLGAYVAVSRWHRAALPARSDSATSVELNVTSGADRGPGSLREALFLAETVYVMATGPGRIAHVHPVTFSVPRALRDLYGTEGTELIGRMREEIRPGCGGPR